MSTQAKNIMAMSAYHSDSETEAPGCSAPMHSQEEDVSSELEDSNELACSMPLLQSEREMASSPNDKVSGSRLNWGSESDHEVPFIRQTENFETRKWIGCFDFVHAKLVELEEKVDRVNQIIEYLNLEEGDFEEVNDSDESDADSQDVEYSDDNYSDDDSSDDEINSSDYESQSYDDSDDSEEEDSDDSEEDSDDAEEDSDDSEEDSDEVGDEESDSECEIRPSLATEAHIVAAALAFIVAYLYIFQCSL